MGGRLPRRRPRAGRGLAERARRHRRQGRQGARLDGDGRVDLVGEPLRPSRLRPRRVHVGRPGRAPLRDPEGDAGDRSGRRARRRAARALGGERASRSRRSLRWTSSSASARRSTSCARTRASRATRRASRLRDDPGHTLAFIGTLDRPEMVGLGPVIVHGGTGVVPRRGPGDRSRQAVPPSPRRRSPPATTSCSSSCSRSPATTGRCTSTSIRAASRTPPRCGTSQPVACAPTSRSLPRRGASPTIPRSATRWPPAGCSNWPSRASGRSRLTPGGRCQGALRSRGAGAAPAQRPATRSAGQRSRPRPA